MRVHIVHRFAGARRDDIERLYLLDDEFNRETFERVGYERRVIERRSEGDRLLRRLHVVAHGAVPAPFSVYEMVEPVPSTGASFTGTTVMNECATLEVKAPSLTVTVMSRTGEAEGFCSVLSKVIAPMVLAYTALVAEPVRLMVVTPPLTTTV